MPEVHESQNHNPPGWNQQFQWRISVEFGVTVWASPATDGESAVLYGDICNNEGLIIFTLGLDLEDTFNDLMVEQHRHRTVDAFLQAICEVDLEVWHEWQK